MWAFIVMLIAMVCHALPAIATEKPIVFIVAGQSTSKCGVTNEVPRAALSTPPQLVEYHLIDVDYCETAYRIDAFTQRRHFGPEVRFVQLYAKANPEREIILLKIAKNGSGMIRWSPKWPGEYADWTGDLYRLMVGFVQEAIGGRDVEYGGLLFVHGENDAAVAERARVYHLNMRNLINRFRKDIGAPDMPVLMSEVSPDPEKYPHIFRVNEGKMFVALSNNNVWLVDNAGLRYRDDGVHYTSEAQFELGMRFYRIYRSMAKRKSSHNLLDDNCDIAG